MGIIRFTLNNPVKIAVGVILICLFGVIALFQIPIQLTPNVDEPRVVVSTRWPGKSAREIEREIVDRQEEKLKGATGLRKLTSQATEGRAQVTLEFFIGTDRNEALRETDEKLNQVSGYPPEVEEPEIVAADAALATPIAWLLLYSTGDKRDVSTLRDFVWEEVKPMLERVDGLASVDVYGGREREVQIRIDPARLAARGITLRQVEAALRGENVNVSAGTLAIGKLEFIYRTQAQYEKTEQVENTVIAYQPGGPVYVHDVATVALTHGKVRSFVRSKGRPVLAVPARRETGSNVIEVMKGLEVQIEKVNREILRSRGLRLELTQVYDETVYIRSSIGLVRNNLLIGGTLAIVVLLVFLRSGRATAVVAVSIPISVIGTMLVVERMDRNINVVMLAGMAFAVGMVDNAVVVLENIYRHRQMGKSSFQAAQDGATEVWGAVLASTLTTMAVFIPVIFVEEEAGQLFRDIAIAITVGVGMSLLVAVLVIPTLSARVLGDGARRSSTMGDSKGGGCATAVAGAVRRINRNLAAQLAIVTLFLTGSVVGTLWLTPPSDYLPAGNRNFIFGFVTTEPGLGVEEFRKMASEVEEHLKPYWEVEPGSPEAEQLPLVDLPLGGGPPMGGGPTVKVRPAPIDNFFFATFNNSCFMGTTSFDHLNVRPTQQLLTQAVMASPTAVGASAFFFQVPLFGGARGGAGNSVEIEIRGHDLDKVTAAAAQMLAACRKPFGYAQPTPSTFDLLRPEIRAVPDRVRAANVGLNVRDIGLIVEAAVDGAYVGGFRDEGDDVDLVVKLVNPDGGSIRDVRSVSIATPTGQVVPISSVVDFVEVGAPQQINHVEEMPAVTLQVQAPPGTPLESVMNRIEDEIVPGLRQAGGIDPSVYISLAGNADKLVQTRAAMFGQWSGFNRASILALIQSRGFLALLVVYLLMAALFESFIHPLAILLTVPLSVVGGFAGLKLVHELSKINPVTPVQQLDVVTMLGFIILLGIVVNNAILIVHQTLNNLRAGMGPEDALYGSVRTRIRPIFMTAFTSIGGMLPLALMPGAGSELYRGLAAVMVGGLLVATVFTIILVPVVYAMILRLQMGLQRMRGREPLPIGAGRPAPDQPLPVTADRNA